MSLESLWEGLNCNAGAVQAVVGTFMLFVTVIYAVVNYQMRNEMKMVRERDIRPIMILACASIDNSDSTGYPVNLYFINSGSGTSFIYAVDCDRDDITINIGPPTNVQPSGKTCLKVWLPTKNNKEKINISYYYWDIEERCYRTELTVICEYTSDVNQLYFVDMQYPKRIISKDKKRPLKIKNWGNGSTNLFFDAWWEEKQQFNFSRMQQYFKRTYDLLSHRLSLQHVLRRRKKDSGAQPKQCHNK